MGSWTKSEFFFSFRCKSKSSIKGAPTPSIDDVNAIANPVLRHRVIPNFNAEAEGINIDDLIQQLIKDINV